MTTRLILIIAICFYCVVKPAGWAETPTLTVAAAADLRKAFQELAPFFEKETGAKVKLVFGSSGLLTKQAANGAPFDLLFSANEDYILDLEKKGHLLPGTRMLYAIGRLVIWTRKEGPRPISLTELAQPLYRRIAIANPEHAPYGAAAQEALQKAGIWNVVKPRLVYGENVQQTLQYAQTGNATVAIVALSLVIGLEGCHVVIPEKLHAPIRQGAGVLKRTKNISLACHFLAFIRGRKGQAILRQYGFIVPRSKP
jgi:molybdate transport system substrate-binding protein